MTSHRHRPSPLCRLVLPMLLLGLASIHVRAQAPAPPLLALDPRELALVQRLRDQIIAAATTQEDPAPYLERIPGTEVSFALRPVPAGTFLLGSPDSEKGRQADEGPQVKVAVAAFWMGQHEVTWNEYEVFMFATDAAGSAGKAEADAVSHPTKPYVEMSFGMGREGFPAISMTHHAASKYCQWLSAKTKRFYRLPTEAEWEYAARAGTQTAYSFGDDAARLGTYAVYQADKYAKVGSKQPNPWGLFDLHGNVSEWTLDQYEPDAYLRFPAAPAASTWVRSTRPYPHSVRGGNWSDPAERLRSAARLGSSADWKMLDPQLPKSVWYHTSAPWIGFRVVRPVALPSAEDMARMWNNGVALDD
ncbi:MAG: formylglycine-generating enzyme family protein [Opitutaceae bacterium]|nr:formylglycine-generating enzyme family protein [Opitutaceae bacterium]